jgi:hypothetical protein
MMNTHIKLIPIALVLLLLIFAFAGCDPVSVGNSDGENISALEPDNAGAELGGVRGAPLATPVAPKADVKEDALAKLFVNAERSMMGFADWQYDTVYETAVSLLTDEVTQYSPEFYRFDRYVVGDEAMKVSDASTLKSNIRDISFYSSNGIPQDATIPADVKRYKQDKIEELKAISPWFPAETLEAGLTVSAYPLENAINAFGSQYLNIVVTDLYELRNGSFAAIGELAKYDVGILAIKSEFSGVLPELTTDGSDLVWGSPATGSYKSFDKKTASYTKDDGTTGYYNYNVFHSYTQEERVSANRTFYILLAGNADQVATVMEGVENKLTEKYANSAMIHPEVASLLIKSDYSSAICEDVKPDTGNAPEYVALNYGEDYKDAYGYEIREGDEVPPIKVTSVYEPDTGASARALSAKDFQLKTKSFELDGGESSEIALSEPQFALNAGEGETLLPVISFNVDALSVGEYVVESHLSILPPEQSEEMSDFESALDIAVDDGTLRQWIASYSAGEQDGEDKMANLMLRTIGLRNLLTPLHSELSTREVLAVRLYFTVV